jgi:hypothetical protein
MGITSKKMANNIPKNAFYKSFSIDEAISCEFASY